MPGKTDPDVVGALLDFVTETDAETAAVGSASEARERLKNEGVNVAAFEEGLMAKIAAAKKAQRLAWRDPARERMEEFRGEDDGWEPPDYSGLTYEQLKLELTTQKGNAVAHFKNFEELTAEDIKTILIDIARLRRGSKK